MTKATDSAPTLTFHTDVPHAPKAVGPYSPAVSAHGFLYLSGQVGLDPSCGVLVEGGIESQTTQALKNLAAVLTHAGLSFERVVKTTIFLTSMADFQVVNTVYAAALGNHRPARSTYAVAGLPLGALVEIEMIAAL
jgi:2-iminobutanoate/2-iminopropanoate deaminase